MNRPGQIPAWGAEGDLRPETPEERDTNKDILVKRREVENFYIQTNSFNIYLKLPLIPNTMKGEMRKVKETISFNLTYSETSYIWS